MVGVAQQRHVRERREFPTEPLVQQQVLGGGADPFLAAHHGVDLHLMVVDHDRQVVGGEAVGLEDHLVVGEGGLDLATNQVMEHQRGVIGDVHAHHRRLGEARELGPLFLGHAVAQPVVAGVLLLRGLLLAHCRQALLGAPAMVGVARGQQLVNRRTIGVQALRLRVGRIGTALLGRLIGREAQPVQRVDDLLLGSGHQAVAVRVLDAQHELSPGPDRPGLVEQRHIAVPTWGSPVGEGATRVRAGVVIVVPSVPRPSGSPLHGLLGRSGTPPHGLPGRAVGTQPNRSAAHP